MAKRTRRKDRLQATLAATETPVFVINAKRAIVFFNAGCEHLTGWSADEMIGTVCDYASNTDQTKPISLANSLCPPPEVLSGMTLTVPASLVCRNGSIASQLVHYFPLTNAQGDIDRILGMVTSLQQTKKRTEATAAQQLHAELASLRVSLRQRFHLKTIICQSIAMLRVAEQIRLATESNASVFLQGESGTGKEHIARVLHAQSPLAGRSFVPIDCRQLPAFELKQVLRRLFSADAADAEGSDDSPFPGLQPGSVYLKNVEALPRDLQEFVIVGCRSSRPWRTGERRLLSSSCTDLRTAFAAESVRPDFYYLLTTLQIDLPPLRGRKDDLTPLAQSLLEDLNRGEDKQVGGFTDEVWDQFRKYNWPGNIDELIAVIGEARAATADTTVRSQDLPFRFQAGRDAQSIGPPIKTDVTPLEPLLAQVEANEIQRALAAARNNKTKAAELLGITRPRLYRRMQTLGIDDPEREQDVS